MSKICCWLACILLFLFYIVIKVVVPVINASEALRELPTIEQNFQAYHVLDEMVLNVAIGTTKNAFYTTTNLGGDVIAYHPIVPPDKKRVRIMIVCGQHAREIITSEVCYALIRLLQGQIRDLELTERLATLVTKGIGFYIVPIANPHGRQLFEQGRECQRGNANGVDLNRNYPLMFTVSSKYQFPGPGTEEYRGPHPQSEVETQSMVEFLSVSQPHMLINVHSGTEAILLPYDGIDEIPPNYRKMVRVANLAKANRCPSCKVGASSILLYNSPGTLMDYAMVNEGCVMATTLEIFYNQSVPIDDCRHYYNPLPGEQLAYQVEKWVDIIISLIEKFNTRQKLI